MVGVVFAARHPERCAKLVTISAGLRPDGWGTATRHLQRELVRDGLRNGDVDDRHDARAAARHADLSRPRRAGHAVREAPAASRAPAGRRVSRSSRPAIRGALSGQDVPAPERGDRSRIDGRRAGGARRVRARQRRNDRRRRSGRHAVSVGAAGRAASRAAGGGRGLVVVETGIAVRPRRVSRRSGSPRRSAARRRRVRQAAQDRIAAAFRRRRRRAGPRDSHRPRRLRHRRRAACSK